MTPQEVKQFIESPIAKAFADGKEVQYNLIDGEWKTIFGLVPSSLIEHPSDYRIKPEPRVVYMNEYNHGTDQAYLGNGKFNTPDKARSGGYPGPTSRVVRVTIEPV